MSFWKHGQQKQVADLAGVTQQYLSDLLNRRRPLPSVKMGMKLQDASMQVCKEIIPWYDFCRLDVTTHPAFKKLHTTQKEEIQK